MTDYDAIIVGARVAGSATAMLLASDTLSTHQVQVPGVARLERWGLLDAVGTPPGAPGAVLARRDRVSTATSRTPGRSTARAAALAQGFDRRVAFALFDRRPHVGRDRLAAALHHDLEDGVRWESTAFVSGDDITIAEARLVKPPENPRHCPPAVTMVLFTQARRTRRMVCRYAVP